MPAYTYRCETCGREDVAHFRHDDPERDQIGPCGDTCGGAMKRIFEIPQILIPKHFQKHTHTTGLAGELGGQPDMPRRKWNNPFGM